MSFFKDSKSFYFSISLLLLFSFSSSGSYLTAKGSKLYNNKGETVRLTGVNWFGFETTNMFPHGLWARDYHGVLNQVREMGFNCLRIPFCNQMFREDSKPDKPNFYGEDPYYKRDKLDFNKELAGLTPLEMLDEIIRYASELGLVIILDNHSREHDGYMNELLWYTDITSEKQWVDDWVMLAKRYKNNPTVIGFDLENEPHGKTAVGGSTWAAGNEATDWNVAAQKCGNAILAENPDVLIIIEGVEQYKETMYWWGGNLRGVRDNPIRLSKPDKLVYSPHEYGPEVFQQPWFFVDEFPNNMEGIWGDAFGYIAKDNIAPLFIGELGISSMDGYEGRAGTWFRKFLQYMADNFYSWTFWALNPNSGDTGGILSNDWTSVVQWKLDAVAPYFAPLINEPIISVKRNIRTYNKGTSLSFTKNKLTYNSSDNSSVNIRLIDLNGKVVSSSAAFTLDVSSIASGTYTAVIYKNNSIFGSQRISIQ